MKQSIWVLFLFWFNALPAQDTVRFTKALMVSSSSRYGREAIYTDVLAWKLYNGTLSAPKAGEVFDMNEKDTILWKEVQADSAGRFRTFPRRNMQGTTNPFLSPGAVDRGADYIYLTYTAAKQAPALLYILGNSGVYFNGVPHMGDPYSSGYMFIPVELKKGPNEIYIRGSNILPVIVLSNKPVALNTADLTLPSIVLNQQTGILKGAITVINASSKAAENFQIKTDCAGKQIITTIASIPAMATRKVVFEFDAGAVTAKGKYDVTLSLLSQNKTADEKTITVDAVDASTQYSSTFVSDVDGSLQYYAVTPQLNGTRENAALFLSVHGAGVEAIGQARAYNSKDWGTLVAATNRRPRGFNWEDWGRLDALEVLEIAKQKFKPDPQHIYLTGHSMGGHGTWFLGATYPDKWAAIAPCSGYTSLKDYGSADGKIPDSSKQPVEQLLLRAGNQSDVPKLALNYKPLGVYILHGDSDRVVPVRYARQMRSVLSDFHADFNYYEYPGGEHWFGNQSVDWPHIFEYFKWHSILPDSAVNHIDFTTSSPGISATYRWATIVQQQHPLAYSRIVLSRNKNTKTISGKTENILLLQLALNEFGSNTAVSIQLDSVNIIHYTTISNNDSIYLMKTGEAWGITQQPDINDKNPLRYGTFKEAFNHNVIFVIGTNGSKEEVETNLYKATYDAESWYYRGNGAIDIITDKQFTTEKYKGRNIIIYGNANNNSAWNILLKDCPVQVRTNTITTDSLHWNGDDLATYFIWPQKDPALLTGVVAATGVKGMKAAYANQYFAGGSGFPDFIIFSINMLKDGANAVKMAGFFNNQWKISKDDVVVRE
ncbi:MAG TPA: prolyl oligopeptidase family serine peptidase [Parafilimonas sp.]|nr:prolyl oligopeptidase family serine peptidase [Parafilimonas sp.]